ncbi:MAG: glycosyltransferase [Desulfovibrionaceae bacterium]|nr:glycosyltransferase [Desulfovibrionaceae bacterium]
MKKVSIVIPCYNQAQYLPACVDHCWFQTYENLELVIVDGGSTDGTKAYLKDLPGMLETARETAVLRYDEQEGVIRKDYRVYHEDSHAAHPGRELKILVFDEDLGRTGTYNAGFRAATGDYATYVVGDDMPHPHMIEKLVTALESTGADLAYSDFRVVDDTGRIVRQVRKPDYDFDKCFAQWFHLGVSTLHRREMHNRVGIMDEGWQQANDYEWYLRMAGAGARFTHVPEVLYSVRFHGHGPALDEESVKLARKARAMLNKA